MACSRSPLNHKNSEKISETVAAANNSLSAIVNLLNMVNFYFPNRMAFRFRPVFVVVAGLHVDLVVIKQYFLIIVVCF